MDRLGRGQEPKSKDTPLNIYLQFCKSTFMRANHVRACTSTALAVSVNQKIKALLAWQTPAGNQCGVSLQLPGWGAACQLRSSRSPSTSVTMAAASSPTLASHRAGTRDTSCLMLEQASRASAASAPALGPLFTVHCRGRDDTSSHSPPLRWEITLNFPFAYFSLCIFYICKV